MAYLLAEQRGDGCWGAPDGYGLVPTLSATEALLTAAEGGDGDPAVLMPAARAGLRALRQLLHEPA